jgi:hypothetical protein
VLHNGATQSRPTREAQASVLSVTIRGLADVASEGSRKCGPREFRPGAATEYAEQCVLAVQETQLWRQALKKALTEPAAGRALS